MHKPCPLSHRFIVSSSSSSLGGGGGHTRVRTRGLSIAISCAAAPTANNVFLDGILACTTCTMRLFLGYMTELSSAPGSRKAALSSLALATVAMRLV